MERVKANPALTAKIERYETFLNEQLKPDLKRVEEARDKVRQPL
jgi:hypothetical protein